MDIENLAIQIEKNSQGNWLYQIISKYNGSDEEEVIAQGMSETTLEKTLEIAYKQSLEFIKE